MGIVGFKGKILEEERIRSLIDASFGDGGKIEAGDVCYNASDVLLNDGCNTEIGNGVKSPAPTIKSFLIKNQFNNSVNLLLKNENLILDFLPFFTSENLVQVNKTLLEKFLNLTLKILLKLSFKELKIYASIIVSFINKIHKINARQKIEFGFRTKLNLKDALLWIIGDKKSLLREKDIRNIGKILDALI